MAVWWHREEHTDDDNFRWAFERAVEWRVWPLFVAQPIAPAVLLLSPTGTSAWRMLLSIMATTWLWKLVRYRFVSVRLADAASWFVHIKWPASIAASVALLTMHHYGFAALAGLWPLITLSLMPMCGVGVVGTIERQFLVRLGYGPVLQD
jgi:hypothetical protein